MTSNEKEFLDYLNLRYKAKITPKHTGNEIMNEYFFCNIKREWDKVSQWVITHIIKNKDLSFEDKVRNIFLARIHNKVETCKSLGIPKKSYTITEADIVLKQNPHAWRNQKFLTRLNREYNFEGSIWCVANHLQVILSDEKINSCSWDTLENSFKSWCKLLGLKEVSFIAYQLALDISYLKEFKDINSWVLIGPGAIRGINLIYFSKEFEGVDHKQKLGERLEIDYLKYLKQLKETVDKEFYISLNLQDIEFNLCEFCKYKSIESGLTAKIRHYKKEENLKN